MSELPEGWCESRVGSVSQDISYGFTTSASSTPNGPKFLRITDIQNGTVDWKAVPFCKVRPSDASRFLLKTGDIVFARTGATTGKSFLLHSPPEAVFASYLIRLRPSESILPELMAYFFQSPAYWRQITENISGSAQPNCNATKLSSLTIPIPPLNEQRRIVAKLEKLFRRVDAVQARLATIPRILKRFRQSVLAAACSGRLTADWRTQQNGNKETFGGTLVEIEIPDSWVWKKLPELGFLARGKSKHRPRDAAQLYGGDYPFIQTGNIARSNGFITEHNQTYNEVGLAQSKRWEAGTVCITIAANIADSAILTYPACFPDSVVGFIAHGDVCLPKYVEFFIRTARSDLSQFAPATAQKNINLSILNEVLVPLPPLAEQREIVRRVEALFKSADALEARYRTAKAHVDKLTQSILARAFRGELVPQDPNDEPASALLERIRKMDKEKVSRKIAGPKRRRASAS